METEIKARLDGGSLSFGIVDEEDGTKSLQIAEPDSEEAYFLSTQGALIVARWILENFQEETE